MLLEQRETARVILEEASGLEIAVAMVLVRRLTRIARKLSKLNEDECNIPGATWNHRVEKRLLRNAATKITAPFGLRLEFTGDPRGSAIRFKTPKSGRYNSMSGDWHIPE